MKSILIVVYFSIVGINVVNINYADATLNEINIESSFR